MGGGLISNSGSKVQMHTKNSGSSPHHATGRGRKNCFAAFFLCSSILDYLTCVCVLMGKVKVKVGPFARRPDNSAFKQQRLPAWSPSLTPHTVLPIFYALSLVCVLLGVWLLITVENTHQLKVSYSVCTANMFRV